MDKIKKHFKNDFGIKNYSYFFLRFSKGYNARKPLNFIKESCISELEEDISQIAERHENLKKLENISDLKDMMSYRGSRHFKNLPTRGQRTKTNGKTNKRKAKSSK